MRFSFSRTHAPKKSAISRTAEREFEREVKKTEQLEENSKQLYKDVKRSLEAQSAQCKQELKISQEFLSSPLCKDEDKLRQNIEQWSQTALRVDALTHDMNNVVQKTVVEPIKKQSTVFPCIQVAVKKREQSLQEYTKCQAKVDKYQEKERTGANIVKLDSSRKALAVAKEDFDNQNSALMEDIPKFYEGRIDYLQPSFQALLKTQVKYYTEAHKLYSELSHTVNGQGEQLSNEEYEQRMQQKLANIRGLSITVDG